MNKAKTKPKLHVKAGDTVIVTSGKDKGKVGTVKESFPKKGKVSVEGVNIVTKAMRANPMAGIQGGLVKRESPISSSKVMLYCVKCEKPTRIKHAVLEDDTKTRICMHCEEHFDI
ncbi:MAG: 50S ribosomal protein L24 [Cyanobacteriota bacterium]